MPRKADLLTGFAVILLASKWLAVKEASDCHCSNNSSKPFCQRAVQSQIPVLFSRKSTSGISGTRNLKEIPQVNAAPLLMKLFHWHHPAKQPRGAAHPCPPAVWSPKGQVPAPLCSHHGRTLPATPAAEYAPSLLPPIPLGGSHTVEERSLPDQQFCNQLK